MARKPTETAETTMQNHAAEVLAERNEFTAHAAMGAGAGDEFAISAEAASSIEAVRQVTLPVLKFEAGQRIYFKIVEAIAKGKEMKQGRGGKPKMEPAEIIKIMGPAGGLRVLIAGAVLAAELRENYPEDAYVGRWFACQKFAPVGDKTYATYHIIEIADPRRPAQSAIAAA